MTAYEALKALRLKVLLSPIGIPASYINEQNESNDLLIGAYLKESLVGGCILTRVDNETVQLRQMAVDKAYQQQGIGAAILSFAEKLAAEKGYTAIVMNARDAVLPFYVKAGYSISSGQFFEIGSPHHQMRKELTAAGKKQGWQNDNKPE